MKRAHTMNNRAVKRGVVRAMPLRGDISPQMVRHIRQPNSVETPNVWLDLPSDERFFSTSNEHFVPFRKEGDRERRRYFQIELLHQIPPNIYQLYSALLRVGDEFARRVK